MVNKKLCNLNQTASEGIMSILSKYPEVIANSFENVRPSTVAVTHRFELSANNPIHQKARRMSPMHSEIVRKEIDRTLAAGVVTAVESSWTFPAVIDTKKDVYPRFCVDYWKLNSVMHADRWPLPRVDEILDDMKGSSEFTTIDLFQGYWQIKMDETCKEKASLMCRYGTFQFEVIPFGLIDSQAIFQRMMDRILLRVNNVSCYVEGMVIFSGNEEEHLKCLENVFATLKENGLRFRIKKCSFMQSSVELLGQIVDKCGVHVDEEKISKIKEPSPPMTRKELRSFLGLASYYRRFVPDFGNISKPLNTKTSEKVTFVWTEEMQTSFDTLKQKLITVPVLAYPDYQKAFLVCTDASNKAIGTVLSQLGDNGREHPIHYDSRILSDTESTYSAFERDALRGSIRIEKIQILLDP